MHVDMARERGEPMAPAVIRCDVLVFDADCVAPNPFRQSLTGFSEVTANAFSSARTVWFIEKRLRAARCHEFQEILLDEVIVQGDFAVVTRLGRIRVEAHDVYAVQAIDVQWPELCHLVYAGTGIC